MKTAILTGLAMAAIAFGVPVAIDGTPLDGPDEGSQVQEDSPEWSCVDDGNRVCGPNNREGKPAACYDDGGVIVAYWPCTPWTEDMGHRYNDGITVYPNGDRLNDQGESA